MAYGWTEAAGQTSRFIVKHQQHKNHMKTLFQITLLTLLFNSTVSALNPVPDNAMKVKPLLSGMQIPTVAFKTADEKNYTLSKDSLDKPIIMTFYRGGWCPYCNKHLAEMRKIEQQLIDMGYTLLFISADSPDNLAKNTAPDLAYTLLSDADMSASQAFGIAYRVDDQTFEKYKGFGLDLEKASGYKHHQLPVPATFLIGTDGFIQFQYVNPDYKIRLAPSILLAAAKEYLKQPKASPKD